MHYSLANPFTLQVLREFLEACGWSKSQHGVDLGVVLHSLSMALRRNTTLELLVQCYWKTERSFRGGTRPMLRFVVP